MPVLTEATRYANGWVFSDSKQLFHLEVDESKGPLLKQLVVPDGFQDEQILAVSCSSSGTWLAICHTNKKVVLFKVDGLRLEPILESYTARRASAITFVNDHLLVVADRFGTIYVVDLSTLLMTISQEKITKTFTFTFPSPILGRCTTITTLACAPSGSLLGFGDRDGLVVIADTSHPERIRKILASHKQYVTRVLFLSDGYIVTSGDSGLLLHSIIDQGDITRTLLNPSIYGDILSFSRHSISNASPNLGVLHVLCSNEMNTLLYQVDLDSSEPTVELLLTHPRGSKDASGYFAIPLTPGYFLDSEGTLLAPTKAWPRACALWPGADPTSFYPAPPSVAREIKV